MGGQDWKELRGQLPQETSAKPHSVYTEELLPDMANLTLSEEAYNIANSLLSLVGPEPQLDERYKNWIIQYAKMAGDLGDKLRDIENKCTCNAYAIESEILEKTDSDS